MLLPLPPKSVGSCIEFDWEVTPQIDCRPIRLLVESHIAHHLLIIDIRVGRQSFVGTAGGAIPGSLFATESVEEILRKARDPLLTNSVDFALPVLKGGQDTLSLRCLNSGACNEVFLGAWVTEEAPFLGQPRLVTHIAASDGHLYGLAHDFTLWKKYMGREEPEGGWEQIENVPTVQKKNLGPLVKDEPAGLTTSVYEVWTHKYSGRRLHVVDRGTPKCRMEYSDGESRSDVNEESLLNDFIPVPAKK